MCCLLAQTLCQRRYIGGVDSVNTVHIGAGKLSFVGDKLDLRHMAQKLGQISAVDLGWPLNSAAQYTSRRPRKYRHRALEQ